MFRFYDLCIFLAAFLSFVFSVYLWFTGNKQEGIYVGIWVPSIIGIGLYGKLLRIVHFVLYRRLDNQPNDDDDHE